VVLRTRPRQVIVVVVLLLLLYCCVVGVVVLLCCCVVAVVAVVLLSLALSLFCSFHLYYYNWCYYASDACESCGGCACDDGHDDASQRCSITCCSISPKPQTLNPKP